MLIEPIAPLYIYILEAIHNWRAAFRNEKGQGVFSELMMMGYNGSVSYRP